MTEPGQQDTESKLKEMERQLAEKDAKLKEMEQKLKLEEMKRQLAEKDAKLKEMEQKLEEAKADPGSTTATTDEGGKNDEKEESKSPPKSDVTLSLRGIPEYDQYPYSIKADKFYFMASIKAPYFRSDKRAPIDLVAVVDESGSMSGDRMRLVKETVQFIIKNLESNDRFGIVGYSSGSRIVLPLTKMDAYGKKNAADLANKLKAGGGTALCAGLVQGVNMMRNRTEKNDVASVMILTDGQANQGPTNAAQINACVKSGKVSGGGGGGYGYGGGYQGGYGGYGPPAPPMNANRRNKKQRFKPQQQQIPQQLQGIPSMPPQQMQQQQIPMQQQVQGMPTMQMPVLTQPPPPMKKDNENIESTGDDLPCTINTFGFGSGHNESLLEAIAENGRGMYAFIENTDMIADTFAECLGGLVSIIGQDLKVQVEALNNVEINKCLSTGYTLTVTKPRKIHTISINNLQSEENRDLIFELKMPTIAGKKEKDPIVQLSVSYKNVVRDKQETLSNVTSINRIEGKQIGERNMELDLQYNRVLAADAMEEADDLANKGKLDEARKILTIAQESIKKSKSNNNQFSRNLVKDIQMVQNNMQNKQQYRQQGGKMLKMNKKAHKMQRSVQSSNYASQSMYCNSSKSSMQSRFQSYK